MTFNLRRSLCAFALAFVAVVAPAVNAALKSSASAADDSLAAALPASDGIILIDMKQLFDKALPSLLASEPTLIEKINKGLQQASQESGIDPRSVEQVAVGFRVNDAAMRGQPPFVALLRGKFDSADLIQKGFKAARASKEPPVVREEKYQGRTIYFVKDQEKPQSGTANNNSPSGMGNAATGKMNAQEVAIVALDPSTIAIGEPSLVRTAIDVNGKTGNHVDQKLIDMATRNQNAVVGFSGYVPASALKSITANGDPVSLAAGGIQSFYGSISAANGDFETRIVLQTEKPDQAQTLSAAAKLGLGFASDALKNSGAPNVNGNPIDPSSFLKYLTITDEGNTVVAVYKIPQADLQPLIHAIAAPKKQNATQSASDKP